jgi:hypothetical protein
VSYCTDRNWSGAESCEEEALISILSAIILKTAVEVVENEHSQYMQPFDAIDEFTISVN